MAGSLINPRHLNTNKRQTRLRVKLTLYLHTVAKKGVLITVSLTYLIVM